MSSWEPQPAGGADHAVARRDPAGHPGGARPLRSLRAVTSREERYRALFDACYPPLVAFARRRASAADADDLVAEVLATAWRRLEDIPPDATLPWLYGVAHRTLANQRRGRDRRQQLLDRLSAHRARPGRDDGDGPDVLGAIGRLRRDDQDVLRLAAWEDLTNTEIALVLDCSTNAAALRLSRARARLRAELTGTSGHRTPEDRKASDA